MSLPSFLRSPPFPQADARVTGPGRTALPDDALALLREARVGGAFWEPHDPWTELENEGQLTASGADERVGIAAILGLPVTVTAPGPYGQPEDDLPALRQRLLAVLASTACRDPFTGEVASFETTVELLSQWRREIAANRRIVAALGMAWWKRQEIRRFLWVPERRLQIYRNPGRAVRGAGKAGGSLAVWPSRVSPQLIDRARASGVGLVRVEDGFVRSVGLGSNLVPPCSVVVDSRGIHFDPAGPSDLEHILATTDFPPVLTARAARLRETIVRHGISKYSAAADDAALRRDTARRVVLVPAQVEDDMSVLAGGGGLTSNLELLRRVRALEPDAEIWFRPHPDVEAGHRKGAVPAAEALKYADRIVAEGGMAALLDQVDAVHVLTSLTGFEALMRGREVTCHGTPFYAGWGLTRDLGKMPDRRGRKLALDELVAGVLILYPRYLDPATGLPCPPEVLVGRMAKAQAANRLGWLAPLRRLQGRLMAFSR